MKKSCRTCKNNIPLSGCKLSDTVIRYCLCSGHMYHPHEYNLWEPINTFVEEDTIGEKEVCDNCLFFCKEQSSCVNILNIKSLIRNPNHCKCRYYVYKYTNNNPEKNNYKQIAEEIANLVTEKQKAYGNSFGEAEAFLKLLYPDGIPVEKYKDMLTLVRIWDKIKRIATDKDALGESPYNDIMGYCLLALNEIKHGGIKNNE